MHVLIIPSWYPKNKDGISGSFFREQALTLKNNNIKVGIIAVRMISIRNIFHNKLRNIGVDVEIDEDMPTIRHSGFAWFSRIPFGNAYLAKNRGIKLFKKYCKLYGRPDLIHVHSALYGGFIALYIKKHWNIPYVLTEHSSAFARSLIRNWQKKMAKKIFLYSVQNIAVSAQFSKFLETQYENDNPWKTVPNILSKSFEICKIDKKNDDKKFKFIHISFLDNNKNVSLIIRAFTKGFKENKNVELIIGGDGQEKSKLELLATEMGVGKKVIFVGMLSRDEIIKYYQESNVFLLSSDYETFGVVVIEALSQGLPVISTRCGGPEDIIQDKDGILIDKNNLEQMSKAMLDVYMNYEKYDREKIRSRCLERYSEEKVIGTLKEIYKSVLDF